MNELKVSLEVSSSTSLPSKTILHVFPNACAYLITLTDNTKLKAFTCFTAPNKNSLKAEAISVSPTQCLAETSVNLAPYPHIVVVHSLSCV